MDPAQIKAMAAGQKDATGPTMMFAQVGSGNGDTGAGEEGGALSKEETDKLGGLFQQVGAIEICW